MHTPRFSPAELQHQWQDSKILLLLNVRVNEEIAVRVLPDSVHIPMDLIPLRSNGLPDGLPIAVYCYRGIRSLHTAIYLADVGFEALYDLWGGIDTRTARIDENVARY